MLRTGVQTDRGVAPRCLTLPRVPPRPLSRLALVPVPLLRASKKASGNRWQQVDVEERHPRQFLGPRTMCSDTFEGFLCN